MRWLRSYKEENLSLSFYPFMSSLMEVMFLGVDKEFVLMGCAGKHGWVQNKGQDRRKVVARWVTVWVWVLSGRLHMRSIFSVPTRLKHFYMPIRLFIQYGNFWARSHVLLVYLLLTPPASCWLLGTLYLVVIVPCL